MFVSFFFFNEGNNSLRLSHNIQFSFSRLQQAFSYSRWEARGADTPLKIELWGYTRQVIFEPVSR